MNFYRYRIQKQYFRPYTEVADTNLYIRFFLQIYTYVGLNPIPPNTLGNISEFVLTVYSTLEVTFPIFYSILVHYAAFIMYRTYIAFKQL